MNMRLMMLMLMVMLLVLVMEAAFLMMPVVRVMRLMVWFVMMIVVWFRMVIVAMRMRLMMREMMIRMAICIRTSDDGVSRMVTYEPGFV